MILTGYIGRRFFLYFIGAALFLATLFNLIEFFEKLIRVASAHIGSVTTFALLHFGPSFVDFLPLSSWLATVIIIRELYHSNEWHTLSLLMVSKQHILSLFLLCGCLAASGAYLLNETYMLAVSSQAEQFRAAAFKKTQTINLYNKSFWLPDNIYCHLEFLDVHANKGKNGLFLYLSPSLTIEHLYKATDFAIDPHTNKIVILNGSYFSKQELNKKIISHETIFLPSFFQNIHLNQELPTMRELWHATTTGKLLSTAAFYDIMHQLIRRIIFYLQILLSPFLTIGLFIMGARLQVMRWALLGLPYIFFLLLDIGIMPAIKAIL